MTPNYFGNGEEFFNPYSLLNAKGVYESQRSVDPNKRVFILTRSAYAGQQRYAGANWSGDIVSRWSDLKEQVSVGINYSISGLPYWTMDIGGFAIEGKYWDAKGEVLDEWRELQTRWYQLGAFCPLFRVHGQYPFREVFNIAPENHPAYKSMVYYNKLRYKLMPYIYTLAADAYHKDYTIMRALVMDFNDDSKVSNIDDQFMFGPSLMINPVHKYKATSRQVYLPASCNWYDFYTGESIKGGQTITAAAPYERIPIYVKEGSIIATGVDMQYTNQYPDSLITLYVYAGSDASTEIYSDASTTYDYEKGQYAYVPVTYNDASGELTIGERKGSFPGMVENQTYKVIFIQPNRNISFGDDSKAITIEYTGSIVQVKFK